MLDESLKRPQDLETFATMEAADSVNFHPLKLGCPSITREAILKAKKLGFKVNIGSSLMTEIGLAHYLNLAASLPELDYPLEEVGIKEFYPSYSVLKPQKSALLTITNGNMKLSSGLGNNINFEDLKLDTLKAFFERFEPSYILCDKVKMLLSNIIRSLKNSLNHNYL